MDGTRVSGTATGKDDAMRSGASVPTTITATATPGQQVIGGEVTITGRLTAKGAPVAGASITLFDAPDAIVRVYVADTTTDASGYYRFTLTDAVASQHSYIVHAAGSATHEPSMSDELSIAFVTIPTTITATSTPGQQVVGGKVTITGRLTANGAPVADAPVTLYNADDIIQRAYITNATTDAAGNYQFVLTDTVPGHHSYVVHAPGTSSYAPVQSSVISVTYATIPSAITTIATPREQYVGGDVTITGQLTANGAPVADAPVTLYHAEDVAQRVPAANTTTDAAGYYQFTLTDTAAGRHSYAVHAPGAMTYAPVQSAGISVTYVALPTVITASATPREQYVGGDVTITGQLSANGAPVADATVTLYHAEDVAKRVPIAATSTSAIGLFELPPLKVTAATSNVYRVYYAGDSAHAPTQSTDVLVHYEAQPAEGAPAQAAPVQAAPVQAAPVQAAPVQAAPVQAAPVQAQFSPRLARDKVSIMTSESRSIDITQVKNLDVTANPAALGLTAFGVTTVLLNLHNAGYFGLNSMILAMGIFYGGLGQVIAGIMEWRKSNTFGTTAFISFGLFWLTLVALLILPKLGLADAADASALAAYFAMWGLFTFIMFVGSLKANRALQVVLGLLTVLFFLLAAAETTGNPDITKIAGYEGLLTGFAAIYAGLAQVLDEMYRKTVAPLG